MCGDMKANLVATLSLLAASTSPTQLPYTEEQVIAYAKSLDVQMLDPSLPSQRLEDWLQTGPPHAHIWSWTVADTCDLKPVGPNIDYPLCAKVTFSRDGQNGQFLTQVGTSRSGIVGRAQLYYGVGVWEGVFVLTGGSERLSELPALLDQPAVTGGVQKLYEEIVAHHPIGIPAGAEMTTLGPFLSKRLAEQLQTAQACEEDYLRQHQPIDGAPKPTWMKSGLFSGDGERAWPISEAVERKEPQKDGSYLVYVFLVHKYTGRGIAYFHFNGHRAQGWHVVATVVSENGRFVVDDVRLIDSDSTEGPSHPLSDVFVGCEGPHWIGTGRDEQVALSLGAHLSVYARVFLRRTSLRTATTVQGPD